MDYRQKLRDVLAYRAQVADQIGKLQDAIFAKTDEILDIEQKKEELAEEIVKARSQEAEANVSDILGIKAERPERTSANIEEEISKLDGQESAARSTREAIRGKKSELETELKFRANPDIAIAELISTAPETIKLAQETNEAWEKAVKGTMALKFLIERQFLYAGDVSSSSGVNIMYLTELFGRLSHGSEYKRLLQDAQSGSEPTWADTIEGLKRDAMTPLPGGKPDIAKRVGGLFS